MGEKKQTPARGLSRRAFSTLIGGAAAAAGLGAPALAQGKARVVVVGGGAGGATAAKYIAKDAPEIEVTLVNDSPSYTTCFFSNLYLAGYRSLQSLTHRYDLLGERYGVKLVVDRALAIDRGARTVRLAGGADLPYDRLVLSPGIAFQPNAVEGYDAVAAEAMPHAYTGGFQTYLLRKRVQAMPKGGVFVIAPPPNPYRCPPGPYERASMAALLLSRNNPRAKVLILDSKDSFVKQELFSNLWESLYPGKIEWTPASLTGGGVTRVDAASMTLTTGDGETVKADAACVIPAQQAGAIAFQGDLVDDGGWAPVDGSSMRSTIDENVFVLGDASRAGELPKSAFAANSEAHTCAVAVRSDLTSRPMFPARYRNTCWSFVGRQDAIKIGASYRVEDGQIRAINSFKSSVDDTPRERLDTALEANSWYAGITADMFA